MDAPSPVAIALSPESVRLAEAVEAHGLKAWRPRAEMDLDGWRVRLSGGFSQRQDCVTPQAPGRTGPHEKITWCESFYHARHAPCVVRLTDLYPDASLEAWLQGRGYRAQGLTHVQVCDLDQNLAAPEGAYFADAPDDRWFDVAMAADKRAALHAETLAFTMSHMPSPKVFTTAGERSGPAAIGCASVEGALMGIFTMRTLPHARRKGLARNVLKGLMAWGRGQGAITAWLQVEAANTAAVALYQAAGFRTLYNYRYLVRV